MGTDVSDHTDVTSWPDVAAAGMSFAGVEAIQGESIVNKQYAAQVTGATSAGLFVMPYVFADPGKISDGATQFGYAWNLIDSVPGIPYARGGLMLPIVLDMESDPYNFPTEPCYGLSRSAMVTWIGQFVVAADKQTGAMPFIYANPDWWAACTGDSTAFGADPLWIADYGVSSPAVPPGWPGYTFWQSSGAATVNGIKGPGQADLDQMQGAPGIVTGSNAAAGSFQVQTLNSLAGAGVGYTASGLAPGLSLSPGGLLTWAPGTAAGAYPVTATPTSPADLPAAVSFTLHVHGTVTVVSPGARRTVAGAPVVFRVATAGPDQKAGFWPSLRATGLPAGVSMSPAGLITGWPSRPGTFKVTVHASDRLGGAGAVTFTWTIAAAGDAGVTGQVRQAGGTGKCLNDPRGATANGTEPNMWTCDGKSFQRWTIVQDDTIRVAGKCLDMAGAGSAVNTAVRLWTCDPGDGAQQWRVGSDGELVNPASAKCLYIPVNGAANGTRPVVHACANDVRHHWLGPAAPVVSGEPGKCLGVAGSAVELLTCANTAAQHWVTQSDGTIRVGRNCLTESGATAGAGLHIGPCSGAAATWNLAAAGPIATELVSAASGLCVTAPSAASGARLVVAACAATPAATWHVA